MTLDEEQQRVAQAMRRYGGGFMNALGAALGHADKANAAKIKAGWPDEWARFLQMDNWEKEQQWKHSGIS